MPGFDEVIENLTPRFQKIIRTEQLIPEWIIGAMYTGKFTFILKEMDENGMTLEVVEEDFSDSEVVSQGPNSMAEASNNIMRPQNAGKSPIDPSQIMPRVS